MAAEWHYSRGSQKYGPVSAAEIKTLAKSGELLPTDMLWKEGMSEWKQAGALKGLFVPSNAAPVTRKEPPPLPLASSGANTPLVNNSEEEKAFSFHAVLKYCKGIWDSLARNLRVGAYSYLPSDGKWKSQDGLGEPFEISGKSIIRGNLLVGTISIGKDKRLEISSGGKVIEAWQIIRVKTTELVFQDAAGVVNTYKLDLWGTHPIAALFKTSRIDHLQGSWQLITKTNEWMQFTKDGAVVFSDGSAGQFTVIGVEPNEVIELKLVKGKSRQFRIVSLTYSQLVIAEGQEAKTFRRPENVLENKVKSVGTGTNDVNKAIESNSGVEQMSKGFLGGLFNFFTKDKCDKCGKYAVEHIGGRRISDIEQRVETQPDQFNNYQMRQMVVNYCVNELYYRCNACGQKWTEQKEHRSRA